MATFVCTASIYVDGVESYEEAAHAVNRIRKWVNDQYKVDIVLPDAPNWDHYTPDPEAMPDYMKGMTPDEYADWQKEMRSVFGQDVFECTCDTYRLPSKRDVKDSEHDESCPLYVAPED